MNKARKQTRRKIDSSSETYCEEIECDDESDIEGMAVENFTYLSEELKLKEIGVAHFVLV